MAENRLTKIPILGQLAIALVAGLVIVGLFWYLMYKPTSETIGQKEQQLATLRQQIQALEATANKLGDFQREVQALEARLEILKRILPPEKEMPDLMRRVQYLAAQSNLRVIRFNPSAPRQVEFYQEVPITLELEGTYHNFGIFLDRISRMSRLVNIGNLQIRAQNQPTITNTIGIGATATTYVYIDTPGPGAGAGARPRPGGAR